MFAMMDRQTEDNDCDQVKEIARMNFQYKN